MTWSCGGPSHGLNSIDGILFIGLREARPGEGGHANDRFVADGGGSRVCSVGRSRNQSRQMTELNGLRSLEEALADIVEKCNQTPDHSRERSELERMIRTLEAEIAQRKTRD